ncbi:MAG: type II toxin-antitoxin system RelE/ParE family toxin [Treponema sp.]|jgi:mRNA interferase RelE/StbE|nr:type II toxin-antitoxin system RelE/ParE family toxin [Treponema sp.]
MKYKVEYSSSALKDLEKMDKSISKMLQAWIAKNLNDTETPRAFGKALKGSLHGLWRYRIGDYRIIADILDEKIVIVLLEIGHRSNIYK